MGGIRVSGDAFPKTYKEASNLGTQGDLVTPKKRRPNASDEQATGHAHVIIIREVNWITQNSVYNYVTGRALGHGQLLIRTA